MTEQPETGVQSAAASTEAAASATKAGAAEGGAAEAGAAEVEAAVVEAAGAAPGMASEPEREPLTVQDLRFGGDGLICAVAQQYDTREVLMVAWMDAEAVRRTLATGAATYFSRSRQEYWVKGETSGHTQKVIEVRYDCDADALLVLVDQAGPACHTGTRSCFENRVLPLGPRA